MSFVGGFRAAVLLSLAFFSLPVFAVGSKADAAVLHAERQALGDVFQELVGSTDWEHASHWGVAEVPVSQWYGVEVSPTTGRVVGLHLSNTNLQGRFPAEALGRLRQLRTVNLAGNNRLEGELHESFYCAQRSQLEGVFLHGTGVQGKEKLSQKLKGRGAVVTVNEDDAVALAVDQLANQQSVYAAVRNAMATNHRGSEMESCVRAIMLCARDHQAREDALRTAMDRKDSHAAELLVEFVSDHSIRDLALRLAVDRRDETLLYTIVESDARGSADVVSVATKLPHSARLLFDNIDTEKARAPPIWIASYHGFQDIMLALLELGADPASCLTDVNGSCVTPLSAAVAAEHQAAALLLLDHAREDLGAGDSLAIKSAAAIGYADIVQRLVEVDDTFDNVFPALITALEHCESTSFEILAGTRSGREFVAGHFEHLSSLAVGPDCTTLATYISEHRAVNCSGEWSPWSDCSQMCGSSTVRRTFSVVHPATEFGVACVTVDGDIQLRPCDALWPCETVAVVACAVLGCLILFLYSKSKPKVQKKQVSSATGASSSTTVPTELSDSPTQDSESSTPVPAQLNDSPTQDSDSDSSENTEPEVHKQDSSATGASSSTPVRAELSGSPAQDSESSGNTSNTETLGNARRETGPPVGTDGSPNTNDGHEDEDNNDDIGDDQHSHALNSDLAELVDVSASHGEHHEVAARRKKRVTRREEHVQVQRLVNQLKQQHRKRRPGDGDGSAHKRPRGPALMR